MGIDIVALQAILISIKSVQNKQQMLTLGRQGIHIDNTTIHKIFNINNIVNTYNSELGEYCEKFFLHHFNFNEVNSIDNSSYENATIIHNLNKPMSITKRYDYIYDGGTIEHIFNIPQALENIINLLQINGIYCSVTCNNNFLGMGFINLVQNYSYLHLMKNTG